MHIEALLKAIQETLATYQKQTQDIWLDQYQVTESFADKAETLLLKTVEVLSILKEGPAMTQCHHNGNVTITLYDQTSLMYKVRGNQAVLEYESTEPELTTTFVATCHSCNVTITTDYSHAAQWVQKSYDKAFSAYSRAQ